MDNTVLNYVKEKTQELINAPSCSQEARVAALAWLDAIGTENETVQTMAYIEELEADIMPIETLIAFAESKNGSQVFGAETAQNIAAHAKEIQAAGAKYCDCPACAAAAAILEKKSDMA